MSDIAGVENYLATGRIFLIFMNVCNKYFLNDCSVPGSFLGVREREYRTRQTKLAVKELTFQGSRTDK